MFRRSTWLTVVLLIAAGAVSGAADDLRYLQRNTPWSPHTQFPKLTTPQWVGEAGVEAVVVLAIDDMRDPARYEAYLRPILQRLKKIDGRAPVSIMTCQVKPNDQQLQSWLAEGLSVEVHTIDHPCPLLNGGDFAKAKSTYDRCVNLLNQIPDNRPVAFRMPCCDSLNTVSPRFYSEIFDRRTSAGHFLSISSSVFNLYTPDDPSIPRDLIRDAKGHPRFHKYIPHQNTAAPRFRFNNFIENYPYPYTINNTCWEFPCMVPSDWEAQNLHKPNNPVTVDDMQAALDITVHKQGVFCLVFHPHGWIQNEQVVQLINHAVSRHGKKVKFLTFPEALKRLNQHLLDNEPLRDASGRDNGVRLVDVNRDGLLDVVIGNQRTQQTRVWQPGAGRFASVPFPARWTQPAPPDSNEPRNTRTTDEIHFVSLPDQPGLRLVHRTTSPQDDATTSSATWVAHRFLNGAWRDDRPLTDLLRKQIDIKPDASDNRLPHLQFHLLSDMGTRLALFTHGDANGGPITTVVYGWSARHDTWQRLPAQLPDAVSRGLSEPGMPRVRFVDLDEDGEDDLILSPQPSPERPAPRLQFWLMNWSVSGKPTPVALNTAIQTMPLIRADGSDNGFFVRDRHLCWQNEDTNQRPDLLHRVSFDDVLQLHSEQQAREGLFPAPRTPQKSAELIRLRPGLRLELVASEPLIRDPVAFDWDVTGRLWVVEMGGYPNGTDDQGQGGGRIRVLRDTDGDGRFDTAETFLDGLNFPTGIQLWRRGVLVTAAPEIFYAEDTDGDGRADVRRTLYRGFAEGNQQHRVNGLRWGLDNWLYVANGDSGGSITCEHTLGTPIKPLPQGVGIGGRDLRIRPDDGRIDPQSGQTQFGRNRDDWGNWFGCNNSHPMWHYALADHYLRRNPHAVVKNTRNEVPVIPGPAPVFPASRTLPRYNDFQNVNRFTSACSTIIYRDRLLGAEFYGNALTSEPVHNLVSRLVLTRDGVTFSGRRSEDEAQSEFLASRDNWFRPTMIRTGPDGGLWIADMYRAVIEHPKWIPADWQARLDLRSGHDRGRIYRVLPAQPTQACRPTAHQASPGQATAQPDTLRCFFQDSRPSTEALLQRLTSPNGWWRDTAQRLLVHRQDKSAVPALKTMAGSHPSPLARLHALCTLDGLQALTSSVLLAALGDAHPGVRRHAVRLSGSGWTDQPDVLRAVVNRLADDDLLVLQQLAYTAGEIRGKQAGHILANLLRRHTTNRWLTAATMSSLNAENMRDVLKATIDTINAKQNQTGLLARLLGQAAAFKQTDAIKAPVLQLLPEPGQPFSSRRWIALTAVTTEFQKHPDLWKSLVSGKQAQARWSAAVTEALRLVSDSRTDVALRVAALRFSRLGGIQGQLTPELLEQLLVPQTPDSLQKTVVTTLAEFGGPAAPQQMLSGWRSHSPALRAAILDALLQQDRFRSAVLDAIQSKTISAVDVDAVRRERLLTTGSTEQRTRASQLLAMPTSSNRQQILERFTDVLELSGDVTRGLRVFEKRCAACHKLQGVGKSIGADLSTLRDRSGSALLTAILDPNRAVEAKFLSFTAVTQSGKTYAGMLLAETGSSLTLIGADGKSQIIRRTELETLAGSNRSLMPEGFEKDLTKQDLADLIRFVQSNGVPRKTFPGNVPRVIQADQSGNLVLPATAAEIFGPSIVLEQQFKNLGYWSSEQDHADWTIQVPSAGVYQVELDYAVEQSCAGDELRLTVAGSRLTGRVPSTRTWENYQKWKLGNVRLPRGLSRLVVSTATKPRRAMIDLRTITLRPQPQPAPR